jgi:deferrochelatase/peroxidase EfeB
MHMTEVSDIDPRPSISRRGFLGAAGGLVAGAAVGGVGHELFPSETPPDGADLTSTIPFFGTHQGGITTAPQRNSQFAAFDVTTDRRSELTALLERWTAVSANLCSGRTAGPMSTGSASTEPDSGEVIDLSAAHLTVNIGFGPSLFGLGGPDRFGLADKRPEALVDLPRFAGDQLIESKVGGDLTVHACADDPQVVLHAIRQLARSAKGIAIVRWAQAGFNETSASHVTPRNLLGFKDGIINPTTREELENFVWVGGGQDQEWMSGGTYLVVRRIRISLDSWDALPLGAQERTIGRHKESGAPLGRTNELDPLDFEVIGAGGEFAIPLDSHVRLASPHDNWNQMLLRRSYAYNDGTAPSSEGQIGSEPETLDAGLFFVAYQQNARLAFIPIYEKLARHDALSRFTVHTGSAVAAIPPASPHSGNFVGQRLFE